MTTRHDVPGGWAEVRAADEVPERLRRKVISAMGAMVADPDTVAAVQSADTPEDAAAQVGIGLLDEMGAMQDAMICAVVASWSFGDTVSVDALLDLPAKTYDALAEIATPLLDAMMPNFDPTPDPKAPTV
jgi:hypothetical protein